MKLLKSSWKQRHQSFAPNISQPDDQKDELRVCISQQTSHRWSTSSCVVKGSLVSCRFREEMCWKSNTEPHSRLTSSQCKVNLLLKRGHWLERINPESWEGIMWEDPHKSEDTKTPCSDEPLLPAHVVPTGKRDGREMAWWLRAHIALPEDLSSTINTHVRWLTTPYNYSSRGPDISALCG